MTDPKGVFTFSLKQAGASILYTPANKHPQQIKQSGQYQPFNVQLKTFTGVLEEDGTSYILEEDDSIILEEA